MKKVYTFLATIACIFILASCGGKGADLLILNWGEYISDELVKGFEEEYGVSVSVVTTDSNELMYQSIVNQTSEYDLVVPSDYMLHQMKEENLIKKIDFSRLENYSSDLIVPELQELINTNASAYKDYFIPYFWGSLCIMYNKRTPGVEDAVLNNGFSVLFDKSLLPAGAKVGMYDVSRDALAAAELYKGYSLNTTDEAKIDECFNLLKNTSYDLRGTDNLKISVSKGNTDVALVYSGDFFDVYYSDVEAGDEANTSNYGVYAPKNHNNVFFDGMAIPQTSTNEDLAYKFLDYLILPENSMINAEYVGYCPTIKAVFDEIMADDENWGDITAIEAYNPVNILNYPNSIAEVYAYLGNDVYSYIERKYTEVLS